MRDITIGREGNKIKIGRLISVDMAKKRVENLNKRLEGIPAGRERRTRIEKVRDDLQKYITEIEG